jgi:putative glutamine amidotransferase
MEQIFNSMRTNHLWIFFVVLFSGFLLSCDRKTEEPIPVKIAFSKAYPENSYANYYKWIRSLDSTAICQDMYHMPLDSALMLFKGCSGLLLTGGTDINPAFYGKAYDTVRCWPIDHQLDTLEMILIDSAVAWKMPILGICRGHQMLNVALGGSLIVDIPSDFGTNVAHKCQDSHNCFHTVTVDSGSLLYQITGLEEGEVNSNHHQAADQMSPQLKAIARTADGLVEAEQWKEPAGKSFLLGVQWHPERLDTANPLSTAIGLRYLEECREFASH